MSAYPPEWEAVSLQTKMEVGFRCVRCGHPNGRWSQPGNDHEQVANVLARTLGLVKTFYDMEVPEKIRIYPVEGGGAWLRHHEFPCDRHCTHDPKVKHWRILTVHHLDGVKENLAFWNLAALCQRCHLTMQGKVHMDQGYQLPHTPWFFPYVAGFYAKTVLREDLTRDEVTERMLELLTAGQPHLQDHYTEVLS